MAAAPQSEYDVIIVGSGTAGLTAAAAAGLMGMKALIIDKGATLGGTTAITGGIIWIPNNADAHAKGDTEDKAKQFVKAAGRAIPDTAEFERLTAPARMRFVERGPDVYSFLETKGFKFHAGIIPDFLADLPGASNDGSRTCYPSPFDSTELGPWKEYLVPSNNDPPRARNHEEFHGMLGPAGSFDPKTSKSFSDNPKDGTVFLGASLIGQMLRLCQQSGRVEVRTETEFLDLVTENGRVVGVKVKDVVQGRTYTVSSRGVFLGTGGFVGNQALREKYLPSPTSKDWSLTVPGTHTGQGLQAALALGAATHLMDDILGLAVVRDPLSGVMSFAHYSLSKPHCIVVDQKGNRFANEAKPFFYFAHISYEEDPYIRVPAWLIFDGQFRRKYSIGMQGPPQNPDDIPGEDIKWRRNGYIIADSISELAQLINIPAQDLTATIDNWNKMCETGKDTHKQKGETKLHHLIGDPDMQPNPNMGPINTGPFYATNVYPGDGSNKGGILINEDGRVIHENGGAIEGLYASGTVCADVLGRGCSTPGSTMGLAIVFSYLAMEHLSNDLQQ